MHNCPGLCFKIAYFALTECIFITVKKYKAITIDLSYHEWNYQINQDIVIGTAYWGRFSDEEDDDDHIIDIKVISSKI